MADKRDILVVGDVVLDRTIYTGTRATPHGESPKGTIATECLGGAYRLYELVDATSKLAPQFAREAAEAEDKIAQQQKKEPSPPATPWDRLGGETSVRFGLGQIPHLKTDALATFAVWQPFAAAPGAKETVWRCAHRLGYGTESTKRRLAPDSRCKQPADVTLIDDADLDLREPEVNQACWPELSKGHVIVKMSEPNKPGPLYEYVVQRAAGRATVVVLAADLRAMDVRITQGISWERTALELVRELQENPLLRPLCRCRNLVVRFDLEGALAVVFQDGKAVDARLVYDPAGREGLRRKQTPGDAIGFATVFTAAIALHMDPEGRPGAIMAGIQTGLAAAAKLNELGHGPGDKTPQFPEKQLAMALLEREQPLPVATIPLDLTSEEAQRWSILRSRAVGVSTHEPLFGVAYRLAEMGLGALWDVPREQVGKFVTVDRSEIEALRAITQLIEVYQAQGKADAPLSIGVFGPPGAGKSFAVKQVGEKLLAGSVPLEFNLSQFSGPEDLIGALHQVRDRVLAGDLPLVFWDEFDSKKYFWLQYLLAPMQDGRFQEGQVSHPIGKCIFVFAGGTSPTFQTFGEFGPIGKGEASNKVEADQRGTALVAADSTLEGREKEKELRSKAAHFALAKGPDFKSRLSGYLNVLGPNPREDYSLGADQPVQDLGDVAYPLRRALMLRGLLGAKGDERLNIDRGLLGALLEVSRYKHGSRSLDKTAYFLKNHGSPKTFRRSDLPAPALLDPHVDMNELLDRASRSLPISRISTELAVSIHGSYLENVPHKVYSEEFAQLPPHIKADNYAAAERIPRILQTMGLKLVEKDSPNSLTGAQLSDRIEQNIEKLAAAEHDGWQAFKLNCGWRLGPRPKPKSRERLLLQHHLLVPYAGLPPEEQKKDRDPVRNYIKILELGGWATADIGE